MALAVCALALGLFAVATMVAVGYLNYTRYPWFDAWAYWTEYLNARDPLTVLFDRMNEHRIVLTRVLYLADAAWFRADTRLLLWSSFLVQLGTAALLYRLACSAFDLSRFNRIYAGGLILTFAFAAPQWINFTWTFLTCFLTVPCAAIGAFLCLKNGVQEGLPGRVTSWRQIATSIVMALIATGSMSNGLLVWPLLVMMAATLRLPAKAIAAITALSVVVFLAYMAGEPVAQASISRSLTKPWELAPFALAYLGSAFDEPMLLLGKALGRDWEAWRVPVAVLAGSIGVAGVAAFALAAVRRFPDLDRNRIAMLYVLGFFVASSALVALGRAQFPLKDALTSRYVTASLLFWACLLVIVTSARATMRQPLSWRLGLRGAVLALACFVGGFPQLPKVAYAADTERFLAEGEYALINDVYAIPAWYRFYYLPGAMIPTVRYFRDHQLSSFTREWTHWIGDPISTRYSLSAGSDCTGAWESTSPLDGSYDPAVLAIGWGYDRRFGRAPDLVVFTSGAGRIVGFASGTRRRTDLEPGRPEVTNERVGWVAYLPAGLESDLTAYVVLGDGRSACRIAETHVPGIYLTTPADKAGPALQGLQIIGHGNWTREGSESRPGTDHVPPEIWSSRAVKSGAALLRIGPVPCGSGSNIGLPLNTSATASTIRVSLVERQSRRLLTEANPPRGLTAWDLWKLNAPAGAPPMLCEYVVEDNDNDPDSWVAAGLPRTIAP